MTCVLLLILTTFHWLCMLHPASCRECAYVLPEDSEEDSGLSLSQALTNHSSCDAVYVSILDDIYLSAPIEVADVSNLTIAGSFTNQKPALTCLDYSGLSFNNVSNIELRNLRFQYCGIVVANATSGYGTPDLTWEIKAAVSISDSCDITIRDVEILNSSGVGMVLANSGGNVLVSHCIFKDNEIDVNNTDVYAGGGGLHIEGASLAVFNIEMCEFTANKASVPHVESNGYSRDENPQYYGRGGGLFLTAASDASFFIRNCNFHGNTAVWGGGIAIFVSDRVKNATVVLFKCTIVGNESPKLGGGGVLLRYWTGISEEIHGNLVVFENCTFYQNRAVFGGGLELIGGLLGPANNTLIHFLACTFSENMANSSAAVDVTQIKQTSLIAVLLIVFTDCEFVGNAVIDQVEPLRGNDAVQIRSGKGTFTLLYLDVKFSRMVRFENNTGTALYVLAGVVRFEHGIEAYFVKNSGHSGGAIALMVSALMFVEANSSLFFIRNRAISRGGAIFALSIGLHSLHKLVVTTCFLGDSTGCQDTVSFYFSGNKAGISGSSIFSNNLQACAAACNWNTDIQPDSIFSCFGRMYFCDECQDLDCFHRCQSHAARRISGPAHRFETTNNIPIYAFPGREFNLSIAVYDIFDNVVNGSYFLADFDDQSTADSDTASEPSYQYVTRDTFNIDSPPSTNTTTLVLHKTGLLDFKLRLGVQMQLCPPGYALDTHNRCTCASYWGVLCSARASITHGKWIGYIGTHHPRNLYTTLCPAGYCSYNTTSSSSSYVLPLNSSELNVFLCSPTRQGRVCGECVPGTSVYYHSPQFTCRSDRNCKLGWLWYILSELVPITIVYIAIMMLNISFTSGSAKGFIFFAQVIETLDVNANGINGLNPTENWLRIANNVHRFIYSAFNLEFFSIESLSFCLWKGAGTLDILIMKYATMSYAFLLVIVTVFVLNRFQLCCKRSSGKSYIIHGLSAFLITCYVQFMRISFNILLPTHLSGLGTNHRRYQIVFYSGNFDFWKGRHLLYAIPALLCTFFIVILPPLALVMYPLYTLKSSQSVDWQNQRQ